jgi:hypothetical protein
MFFYYILELFRHCGILCFSIIFLNCSDSVVFLVFLLYFWTVPTVWYFLFFYYIFELFRQCGIFCFSIIFLNCSDTVVFYVFLLYFWTVPTVWYFLFFYYIFELFRQCGILCFSIIFLNCSDRKTRNTTLSEQFKNIIEKHKIPQCRNSSKI